MRWVLLAFVAGCSGLDDPASFRELDDDGLRRMFERATGRHLVGLIGAGELELDLELAERSEDRTSCVQREVVDDRTRYSMADCELHDGVVVNGVVEASNTDPTWWWTGFSADLADGGGFELDGMLTDSRGQGNLSRQEVDLVGAMPTFGETDSEWIYRCEDVGRGNNQVDCSTSEGATMWVGGLGDMLVDRRANTRLVERDEGFAVSVTFDAITLTGRQTLVFDARSDERCVTYTMGRKSGEVCR